MAEKRTARIRVHPDKRTGSRHSSNRVGYANPPQEHRFKPGESGNLKGRPKGAKSESAIIATLLNRRVKVREGDRVRSMSALEAIYLRMLQDCLKGNVKTASFLLNRSATTQTPDADASNISAEDREILEAYAARLTRKENPK